MKQLFTKLLQQHPDFATITASVAQHRFPLNIVGLSAVHKANMAAALCNYYHRTAILLTPDEPSGRRLCEDLKVMCGEDAAAFFPMREFCFRDVDSTSHEYEHKRLNLLGRAVQGSLRFAVASIEGALQYTIPPEMLNEATMILERGKNIPVQEIVSMLVQAGYVRREQVDGVSQFAVRGGILDLYPPHCPRPVRVEFWGDEIDSLNYFDLDTQRRDEELPSLRVTPAKEVLFRSPDQFREMLEQLPKKLRGKQREHAQTIVDKDLEKLDSGLELASLDKYLPLLYPKPATLFDYFPEAFLFVSEFIGVKEAAKSYLFQLNSDLEQLFEEGLLCKGLDQYTLDTVDYLSILGERETFLLDTFARAAGELAPKDLVSMDAMQLSSWSGEQKMLLEELRSHLERRFCTVVLAGSQRAAKALASDLNRLNIAADYVEDVKQLVFGKVYVLEGTLSSGYEYPRLKLAVITHAKATASVSSRRTGKKQGDKLKMLSDLAKGDLVVHVSHGIGVFDGICPMEVEGIVKDYIKINYAGADVLYVPVTQLDLVSKYIGPREDKAVKLSRLNSAEWTKTRTRVKKAVKDMAQELIQLYSARMKTKGFAFDKDDNWQQEFEERFEWQETDDQLRCVEEIKEDMEKPVPMERLLCGDVGFGKTEVALRAAFKCVNNSKQCAILVPTTILAWQHYQTILKRMEGFPITVELLSRFRTPKQQEEILRRLKRGQVDIIVGTHRLIQKDVIFKDLGLAVVDEEQRFGVAHKEKFKEMFHGVDLLNLSATPIPRTLNMAMSGIRDMSVIEEAPQDRHPIQTYVLEHDPQILADAMRRELRRGGQVFYLHNRVESIQNCAGKIAKLLPEARITIAHGKMSEDELSVVWQKLIDHEVDILVCTTIIETGVDVPNCNTLIIENADNMGLSQLYQIRGRVGRSSRRAYAYFTFTRGKVLSEVATKRLTAIKEFTSFGSGFRIAMRDLEIRGAGNILGAQQHGHMESVGYDMYLKLLADAISEEKGEQPTAMTECLVDIRIEAHIPEKYISDTAQRLDVYRKIASVRTEEDSYDIVDELCDRFGDMPDAVKGLIDVALLRNRAAAAQIKEISQKGDNMMFYSDSLEPQKALALAKSHPGRCQIVSGQRPGVVVRMRKGDQPLQVMKTVIDQLS